MAVIQEYMNGNCKITVHDDSFKSPEEVQERINRVSRLVLEEDFRLYMEELKKKEEETA